MGSDASKVADIGAVMCVVKRNGESEPVSFDKILVRIKQLCEDLPRCNATLVSQKVVQGVYDGVPTCRLDELAAETCMAMALTHPDYGLLAGRIAVSNLHKQTTPSFSSFVASCAGRFNPLVASFVRQNAAALDRLVVHERDSALDFMAFKTLERSYLLRDRSGKVIERPQHLWMRVAVGLHCDNLERCEETYTMLSTGRCTHATPTLFHAGLHNGQLASCFLMPIAHDSITSIFAAVTRAAHISKHAGGLGLAVSNVRAKGSRIQGSGGTSNGLPPMLQVFDRVARYVDQGGGKRKGAFAVYVEPWHDDIFDVLEMRKNHGNEDMKARDLFYGLWIPDLFMQRVEIDGNWSLFSPSDVPSLCDVWGDEFERTYISAEDDKLVPKRTVRARDLFHAIIDAQIETGMPYMLYKDACNRASNHQHLGTTMCSNLCTEIVQYSSATEVAVCNLASVALPACVRAGRFDFEALDEVVRVLVRNLNRAIDCSYYPVEEAFESNSRHRPMGIGVQGLADVFMQLGLAFESDEARQLNYDIFEAMYYTALDESIEEAIRKGAPYSTYAGSLLSKGVLHPDVYGVDLTHSRHDWGALRAKLKIHGARNSMFIALMPTASTAQILGNTECFEPITSNLYTRRVLAGEFAIVNRRLVNELDALGLWTEETRQALARDEGSVQHLHAVPEELKSVYKTAWEMKMKNIIQMAADRAPFVDQSQSLNVFMAKPTHAKISSLHMFAWRSGLKTGMYYLRIQPSLMAHKVTLPAEKPPAECLTCSA